MLAPNKLESSLFSNHEFEEGRDWSVKIKYTANQI